MFRNIILAIIASVIVAAGIILIARHEESFDQRIQRTLDKHYSSYHDQEYFSGIALSVYLPNQEIRNYYVGKEAHDAGAKNIDQQTLFEIGSITKSFIAALILQLEKEKRLNLTDKLKSWLPEYGKWGSLTINSLLNMTSGLPNYTDAPMMNALQFQNPVRKWMPQELIDFVYPQAKLNPPLRSGYFYTNTGYILSGMIIEKASGNSVKAELESRLFNAAHLQDTYYPVPALDEQASKRLAHGYSFNPYSNPELLGKATQMDDMSWAGAAGAIISNPADIIKWVRALFIENTILDQEQKDKLTQLVSTTTGKNIANTTTNDPEGFALGVAEAYNDKMGKFWFYEGETEGFRAFYVYVPETGIIISCIFNSAVNGENDHGSELMRAVYKIAKRGSK